MQPLKLTAMLQESPLSYISHAQPSSFLAKGTRCLHLLPLDQFELARDAAEKDVPSAYTAPADPF